MRLVDTHCHLDLDAFDGDRCETIARAWAAGVGRMVVIGFEPECWARAARLAREVPGISLALGLHPTEAEQYDEALALALRRAATEHSAVAIGETGMDFHHQRADAASQRRAFRGQIEVARELGLPFIVHQRDAPEETLQVLREAGQPLAGVMHCFTGDRVYAEACLDLGLYLGLGGAVTFKRARALHEVVRHAPLERLVLETDAPFLAPSPHRGERNEPGYVDIVARRVAELRADEPERIAEATTANAERLFGAGLGGA